MAPIDGKPKSDEVLNAIIPSREWIQGGKPISHPIIISFTHRQALDLESEPVAGEQDRCSKAPRDARLEVDGKVGA